MKANRKSRKPNPFSKIEIPDKLYFRIGEVSTLLDVGSYVLRFWESEFTQLHPVKGGSGQRLYRRRDVETAFRIKQLLYDELYTIHGARQLLKAEASERQTVLPPQVADLAPNPAKLRQMHSELQEIAVLLARPLPGTRRLGATARAECTGLHLALAKIPTTNEMSQYSSGSEHDGARKG